ncbi:MAG: hypothetical protein KJ072_20300 [Verrucomicrobia bacterium]|nr:hypothetical protein [Verrucomicrobiota bacterium]
MKPRISTANLLVLAFMVSALATQPLQAQAVAFDWAQLMTSVNEEHEHVDTVADAGGNALIAYRPRNDGQSIYVSNVVIKLDESGNKLWSLNVLPHVCRLAADVEGGILVAGSLLRGQPWGGLAVAADYFSTVGITNEGSGSAYVAKLTPAGAFEWVRLMGNVAGSEASAVAVDHEGNYLVAGWYSQGSADFGGTLLPATETARARNLFVVKYTPGGQVRWVRVGQGIYEWDPLLSISIDRFGNVLLGGYSGPPYSFDGGNLMGNGTFLIKFDSEGKLSWTVEHGAVKGGVTMDLAGNVFLAGNTYSEPTGSGLLLNKYSPGGDLLWTRQAEVKSDSPRWSSASADSEGNCLVSGSFGIKNLPGSVVPGEIAFGKTTISTLARSDLFVVKYNGSGDVRWVVQSEGQDPEGGATRVSDTRSAVVTVDPRGSLFVGGSLKGTVRFGTTTLEGPPKPEFFSPASIVATHIIDPDLLRPLLRILRETNKLHLSWSSVYSGFILETADALPALAWNPAPTSLVVEGDQIVATIETGSGTQWFRLRKP